MPHAARMMLGVPHIDARRHSGTAPVGGDAVVESTDKQQEEQEAQRTRQSCHRASLDIYVTVVLVQHSTVLFCEPARIEVLAPVSEPPC